MDSTASFQLLAFPPNPVPSRTRHRNMLKHARSAEGGMVEISNELKNYAWAETCGPDETV